MQRFENKNVLVTGAGQGIGFDICRNYALEGAMVGLNDVNNELAKEAAAKINEEVKREAIFPYVFDVSDVEETRKKIKAFCKVHGGIHVMVANAGITNFGAFLDDEPKGFNRLMNINMRGTYFSVQAAAREMVANKIQGRVLLMSSVCGVQAHLKLSAYSMSKAGIRMLAKSLAIELGPYGITVNALGPGATLTERTLEIDPQFATGWQDVNPNNIIGKVSDISASALFLTSDEARHISGEILMIDGGWTIYSPLPNEGSGAD